MRIAIVHDWLTNMGGAEKLVEIFHKIYPEAPIYTLIYNQDKMPPSYKEMDIRTSYLQRLPFSYKHQLYLQFMPTAVEQFDLSDYDLVLSSTTACAKGVLTRAGTCHICYCNTPMRYAWDFYHDYARGKNWLVRSYIAYQMNRIRMWDKLAADRVDYFIANSRNVARRIQKHYRRDAHVIYPPVDINYFTPTNQPPQDYFLSAGRLVGYKRVDLAIATFSRMGLPLWVAGEGPEYKRLKKLAGPSIKFLGEVSNEELLTLYRGCRAFVFSGEEDFGITPLESQACGRPVIAFGKGGALETVVSGETGVFFNEQSVETMVQGVNIFLGTEDRFCTPLIRKHAEVFGIERFKTEISSFVTEKYGELNRTNNNR